MLYYSCYKPAAVCFPHQLEQSITVCSHGNKLKAAAFLLRSLPLQSILQSNRMHGTASEGAVEEAEDGANGAWNEIACDSSTYA